jgi:hypothetical protein
MLDLLTVVKLNNLPLLLLLQIDRTRTKLRQLDNDSVQEGAGMLAAAASRLSARRTITPMEVEHMPGHVGRQAVKDVQAPVSSAASTTAEVPSINLHSAAPVTISTDAIPQVSFTQPAGAAAPTKMAAPSEVGIGRSCGHA